MNLIATFTEKRFFKWVKDDVSVSLRNRSGSYSGGSEVFVITEKNDRTREQSESRDDTRHGDMQRTSCRNGNGRGLRADDR